VHNEELHDLYSSPSIIRIIRSRRMRWAGHVAQMGEKRNAYRLLVVKPEGERPLGRPNCKSVDWTGLVWLRISISGGGSCELGNEPLGLIKWLETKELLHSWWPLE
jgi:hypothetical protein